MLLATLVLENPHARIDSGAAQPSDPSTRHRRMWIDVPQVRCAQARGGHSVGAGARAPDVTAGFQRDGQGGAVHELLAMPAQRLIEGHDFRVWATRRPSVAATEDAVAAVDDRAHGRIREASAQGASGLGQGEPHRGLGAHRSGPALRFVFPTEAKNFE